MPTVCCPNCRWRAFALPPEITAVQGHAPRPGNGPPQGPGRRFWSSRPEDRHALVLGGPDERRGYGGPLVAQGRAPFLPHRRLAVGPRRLPPRQGTRPRLSVTALLPSEPRPPGAGDRAATTPSGVRPSPPGGSPRRACVHGHPLDEANTAVYRRESGTWGRRCRATADGSSAGAGHRVPGHGRRPPEAGPREVSVGAGLRSPPAPGRWPGARVGGGGARRRAPGP